MDGKTLARIGAIVFVALGIVATAIEVNRPVDQAEDRTAQRPPLVTRDPLDAELTRCSGIGEARSRDPSCLKAWAENRRRFLGQPATAAPPAASAPATLFPSGAPTDPTKPATQSEGAR